ncbi:MAG: hypothetical protein ACRDZQ_03840 [Acidimicrobiales bacterium]
MARGRLPGTGEEAFAVIEASWRLDDGDLAKVVRRADLVRATGVTVVPVLLDEAEPTDHDLLDLAAAAGVRRVHLPAAGAA